MLKIAQLMFIILMLYGRCMQTPQTPHTPETPHTTHTPQTLHTPHTPETPHTPHTPHPIGYSILFEKWYYLLPYLRKCRKVFEKCYYIRLI
ncbi:hypothetical protein [Dapis sp. BLCC M229]|uniref:hypothetical protein n=1 Tax=Dapis sp. BLCC M229 TaxID=3400188 RepID=UPI003CEC41EC